MLRRRGEGTAVADVGCNEARKPTEEGGAAQVGDAFFAALEQFSLDFMEEREQPVVQNRDEVCRR
ncbi:AbrB/MazE/SpoVT family DNA-binding domain-containing protein [Solidesulfovibrio sp.]